MRRKLADSYLLYFIGLFFFFVFFQANRILQIKSPVSFNAFSASYFLYGLILLIIPFYIILFIYLPSLLIIKISLDFPKQHFITLPPVQENYIQHSNQIINKPNLQLLCMMRC